MTTGRRGRPYQVPEDTTSLNGPTIDVDSRVGWLLLMSRLHHANPDLALGESFNMALREAGLQADRSAVSRWESGKVTPRYSVLMAYERALGLRAGQLTSVVNAQRRAFGSGGGPPAWRPILDASTRGFHERLDSLFDVLLDGSGTGPEWTALAHHVSAAGTVYVHGAVWRHLSEMLVDEMTRSVGVAYLQRFEALKLLLEHRVAHPWLLSATGDFLDDPAVQIVNDPVSVLEASDSVQAAQLVLDKLLTTQSPDVLAAAANAVALKIDAHCYTARELDHIEQAVSQHLRSAGASAVMFEELIMTMPEPARARLLQATRGFAGHEQVTQSATHGERISPEVARRVSQRLADSVRGRLPTSNMYDDDKMTPRLIREALFSARSERGHYASLALVGSPFKPYLAAALAEEIQQTGLHDPMTTLFARLLRYLAVSEQEEALVSWLPAAPDQVVLQIALTLGHLDSQRGLSEILPLIKGDGSLLDRALVYGLGMRQSAALQDLASDESRPARVREAADWWLRHGGAVRL